MLNAEDAWMVEECWHEAPRTAADNSGHCHNPPHTDLGLCRQHLESMRSERTTGITYEPTRDRATATGPGGA